MEYKWLDNLDRHLRKQTELLESIRSELVRQRPQLDLLALAAAKDELIEAKQFFDTTQLDMLGTLRKIIDNNMSLARFGDGELRLAFHLGYVDRAQKNTHELQVALKSVLKNQLNDLLESKEQHVLVGMPQVFRNTHWAKVWFDTWPFLKDLLSDQLCYGHASISRPLFFERHGQQGVELWRELWDGRRIMLVTGKNGRFEFIEELFGNASAIERLDGPPVDAFSDLDNLTEKCLKSDADLFLLSLGATATVLADRLARAGRQALDIGNITASYLNVFKGGAWPESLPLVR
ncbi:GT-D fold domain-containing glycosyltransferase [Corynebacterium mendelii]|uniref:DUF1792 domain-containing protein n=1 Tax=Corynebacterium mendelii TaxID=2765362 RepID=A0A939E0P2_9CORY|nr:GT-D fold domain-containing glycosyltransferase [Corynebacterium mendelii]MBN9644279.1 DUF1792 domain-containing protein [Corynebacterium mendelii]